MTFSAPVTNRLLYLLFAVAFLGATEGQAYGLRDCPYHDALPGSDSAAGRGTHQAAPRSGSALPAPVRAPVAHGQRGHEHPGGACTCLTDCHVGTSNVAPVTDPALRNRIPDTSSITAGLQGEGSLRGPRHRLFELHLPNAPPALL